MTFHNQALYSCVFQSDSRQIISGQSSVDNDYETYCIWLSMSLTNK